MRHFNMKLTIELVPKTCWYGNLRKVLPSTEWDKIRKEVYRKADYKCEICGKTNTKLNCHEKWSYDDERNIQKLEGFQALCTDCHWVKHIGLAQIMDGEGKLDIIDIELHFEEVNNVSAEDYLTYLDEAFSKWAERSNKQWTTDLGEWQRLINKKDM